MGIFPNRDAVTLRSDGVHEPGPPWQTPTMSDDTITVKFSDGRSTEYFAPESGSARSMFGKLLGPTQVGYGGGGTAVVRYSIHPSGALLIGAGPLVAEGQGVGGSDVAFFEVRKVFGPGQWGSVEGGRCLSG